MRRIRRDGTTACDCGESSAFHTDDVHVEVRGENAQKVFIDNRDLANALFLSVEGGRLYATFDWRTQPGYKGGAWLRADEAWEPEESDERSGDQPEESDR
jgi:hypothetical protein